MVSVRMSECAVEAVRSFTRLLHKLSSCLFIFCLLILLLNSPLPPFPSIVLVKRIYKKKKKWRCEARHAASHDGFIIIITFFSVFFVALFNRVWINIICIPYQMIPVYIVYPIKIYAVCDVALFCLFLRLIYHWCPSVEILKLILWGFRI